MHTKFRTPFRHFEDFTYHLTELRVQQATYRDARRKAVEDDEEWRKIGVLICPHLLRLVAPLLILQPISTLFAIGRFSETLDEAEQLALRAQGVKLPCYVINRVA